MSILFIRTIIIYSVLLLTMRLLGKRQLGEMELSEFVLAALIADIAAIPLQDIGIPMINSLVPIAVLFAFELAISALSLKNIRLRKFLFGKPSVLISNGVIDQRELRRSCFTLDELMQELRNQGCLDISQVEYAILETDGRLNVFLYPEHMPATAGQLGIQTATGMYPTIIVCSGRVLGENLRIMGRDRRWLDKELSARGFRAPSEVFLMTLNRAGGIYIAGKDESQ